MGDAGPIVHFAVSGPPVGRQRPRHRIVWPGRERLFAIVRNAPHEMGLMAALKRTLFTQVYHPTRGDDARYVRAIRAAAQLAYRGPLLERPLRLDVDLIFPRHQSQIWKAKPMPAYPHTTKPDADNCEKCVMDALTGTVWLDDGLVCEKHTYARRAAGGESPRTVIAVGEPSEEFWRRAGVRREPALFEVD